MNVPDLIKVGAFRGVLIHWVVIGVRVTPDTNLPWTDAAVRVRAYKYNTKHTHGFVLTNFYVFVFHLFD